MSKQRSLRSPAFSFLLLILVAVCLITLQIVTGSTVFAVSMACLVSLVIALACNVPVTILMEQVSIVLRRSANAIIILAVIAYACGVWLRGGTIAAMLYWTAKVSTPQMSLVIAFLACGIMAYVTGSSFSTISSMGIVTVLVAVGFGMEKTAAVGAVVSGAILGNKISPVSDTVNLTCAVCGVANREHRRALQSRTVLAAIITAVVFLIMGLTGNGNSSESTGTEMCMALEQSFHISFVSLLPLVLLIVLTYTRLSTIQNLLICTAVSIAVAVFTQRAPVLEVVLSGVTGFSAAPEAAAIVKSLSGGGLAASMKTLAVICLTSILGGILTASSVTPVLFNWVKERSGNYRRLRFTCLLLSLGILCISGNQILAIILMAPEFMAAFEKYEGGKMELAGIFADTTVVAGPLLPWSVMRLFISQVFSLSDCSYIPYSVFCMVTVILAFIRILFIKSDAK